GTRAMTMPLLATKLYVPAARSDLVPRPRLLRRLGEGLCLDRQLTLVAAPAGSGKSTLLAEWVRGLADPPCDPRMDIRAAWLSLDEEDNEPARFWAYFVQALCSVDEKLGAPGGQMLQAPQVPPAALILSALLNEVAALPYRVVLVLDDFHLISDQGIVGGIAFLLEHQPRQLHLVLSARGNPPLPIARLRARGLLTEVRAGELAFTVDEAVTFLNDRMGLDLSREEVRALESRTEGWAAGLQLAAMSMQERTDRRGFIASFSGSHHFVLEYLAEEVLARQPEAVQRFLLQTSLLDRLCGPLCAAVTGTGGSDATLLHLHRKNLFLVALDDENHWYRYHHLFADLLRKRLEHEAPAEEIRALYGRASAWHREQGTLDEAIQYALKAGDAEQVAGLAEEAAVAGALDSRLTTLLHWVERLPPGVMRAHPRLQIYCAWALYMNGRLGLAQQMFDDSRQALEDLPPSRENDALREELTTLLAIIALVGQGLMCSVENQLEKAIQIGTNARAMALEARYAFLAAQATEGIALAEYHQGRLRACAESCQQVIGLVERGFGGGWPAAQVPLAAAGYVELAGLYTEWNELEAAADLLERALDLCRRFGVTQTLCEVHVARSRLKQAQGDVEGAVEALREAEQVSRLENPFSLASFRLATQQARLNLAAHRPAEVVAWVRQIEAVFASGQTEIPLPAAMRETIQTTLARAYLARGEAREARAVLEPLLAPAEAAGAFLRVAEICALQALAWQACGNLPAALAALGRALSLAEPEGRVRLFLDEGPPMARLLYRAVEAGIVPAYAGKLLAAFPREGARPTPDRGVHSASPLVEPLTAREREILALIAEGLSNKEIAQKLVLTTGTVKAHAHSIYGKLGVSGRTQAVARARELGLFS
ncbi:MAG: helix-turn-helix transcriptional regulator, partial [Anaerolineae bacterium]|nr:helix-turn-helix transcriptional regulator [Anaerolineae bacterium]